MNNDQKTCDPERIELSLQQKLSDEEQAAFELHLDDCDDCRRRLEATAAGADMWSGVRDSLLDQQADCPPSGDPALDPGRDPALDSTTGIDASFTHETVLKLLAPTDDDRMLGRLGTYEVVGIVGSGGMGVVLKAFDAALNRYVAIKVLAPHLGSSGTARKRFSREAQAAAAVVHDNVMEIHGVADADGLPYLVMPYVRGPSLQRRLDDDGPLALVEILRIGLQAATGLAAAHAQGLVHRDVKPANILLEDGVERVKLTDFGLARAADDASLTRTGVIAGTPQYMSPEQSRGESVDQRSDLFSLGSVLYAMCTGRAPFRAETSYGVLRRITDEEPRPIRELNPDIPEWLCRIIDRLMSKQPDDRFESAAEVAELLEECLAHVQQPTAVPLPASLATQSDGSRFFSISRRWFGAVVMIATFSLSLLGMVLWQASAPPDISGNWTGEEWVAIVLKLVDNLEYTGTYTDTFGSQPGEIELKWNRIERRFNGTWREGDDRFGELSIRLVGNEIRGALTTDPKSKINPATPRLADLLWAKTVAELESPASSVELPYTKATLPDVDRRDVKTILDLSSGEFQTNLMGVGDAESFSRFNKLGKGDLCYDQVLGTARGATVQKWDGKKRTDVKPGAERYGARNYPTIVPPVQLLVTTAEGKTFDVKLLGTTGDGGLEIEYRPANVSPNVGGVQGTADSGVASGDPAGGGIDPVPAGNAAGFDTPAPSVTGRVTSIDGHPAPGYRVTALPGALLAQTARLPTTTTDENGAFVFRGLPDGPCDVSATPTPLTNQPNLRIMGLVLKKGEPVHVDLSLEQKFHYAGRVTNADGKPQPDCNVLAIWKDPDGKHTYSSNTKTDSFGRYHFSASFPTAKSIELNGPNSHRIPACHNITHGRDDIDFRPKTTDRADINGPTSGRLDLRVAAERGDDGETTLDDETVEKYIDDLKNNGPEAGRRRGDPFVWFPMIDEPQTPLITADHESQTFVLLANTPQHTILCGSEPTWSVIAVSVDQGPQGSPWISVELDEVGGRRLGELTESHLRRPMAILVDDRVLSAPTIQTKITQRFQITGSFDIEEAHRLARTMMPGIASSQPTDDAFDDQIERLVNDDKTGSDWMIDLDTGKLYTPPTQLDPEKNPQADIKKLMAWVRQQGIDATGIKAQGGELQFIECVLTFVDKALWESVTRQQVRDALWESVTRQQVRDALAEAGDPFDPFDKAVVGDTLYAFRTREGGMGVLQVVGCGEDSPSVKIRYKLLPQAGLDTLDGTSSPTKVHLPDADTPGANVVLDLASGKLLASPDGKKEDAVLGHFRQLGKGDIVYDKLLLFLRGTKVAWWNEDRFVAMPLVDFYQGQIAGCKLPGVPCRLLITTAEKKYFDVTICSRNEDGGINLEYRVADPALVPDTKLTGGAVSSAADTTAPVLKAVINDIDDKQGCEGIDLDRAWQFDLPDRKGLPETPNQLQDWVAENRVDILVEYARNRWGLVTRGLTVKRVANDRWDVITATELDKVLSGKVPAAADGDGEILEREGLRFHLLKTGATAPMTFVFETAEGSKGILQIVEFSQKPTRMTIQFRLLKPLAGVSPPTKVMVRADGTANADAPLGPLESRWRFQRYDNDRIKAIWRSSGTSAGEIATADTPGASGSDHDSQAASEQWDNGDLALLARIPNLSGLWIQDAKIPSSAYRELARFPKLEELVLYGTDVDDAALALIAKVPNLKYLDVNRTKVTDEGLEHLADATGLIRLNLAGTRITDRGLEHLASLKNLQYLALYQTAVSDAGLTSLKDLLQLENLFLGETQVTDRGLMDLKPLGKLKILYLHDNAITDDGLRILGEMPSLECLSLIDTRITDAGLTHLTQLKHLQSISVRGSKATEAGLARFQETMPDCKNDARYFRGQETGE